MAGADQVFSIGVGRAETDVEDGEVRDDMLRILLFVFFGVSLSGCAVGAVGEAVVSTTATAVKAGTKVVGTAVEVTADGVKSIAGGKEK